MNKARLLILACTHLLLLASCNTTKAPVSIAAKEQSPPPPTCPSEKLKQQFEEIAKVTGGPVGAAAMLLETGQLITLNGDRRFPTQSVYKLPIAIAVYQRVDAGTLSLDQTVKIDSKDYVGRRAFTIAEIYPQGAVLSVRDLVSYMIKESDGTACDALLRLLGGPEEVTKYLRGLGIENVNVARYEKEMWEDPKVAHENWSTPEGMAQVLRLLHEGKTLSAESNEALLAYMTNSRPGPKRLKGMLPPGTNVAHKTGTSGTINGVTAATNDVGLITLPNGKHLAVAVFVSDTRADLQTREGVIARIAKATWDCMLDTPVR